MTIEYPVAGRWTSGESSREVRSPFDDAVIAQIPSFSAADVDAAVEVAHVHEAQAFPSAAVGAGEVLGDHQRAVQDFALVL